jgi:tRNA (guanine-N7-)-methyltransferase
VSDLDTTDLYITRKRKLWKFAHFSSYPNCFEHVRGGDADAVLRSLQNYFPKIQPMTLELAAGNAQFSYNLAKKYPHQNFIAIDIKSDRLYTSAKQALAEGVNNIAFLRMSIDELEKVFPANFAEIIWLTFPDPFMRKRSIRRRLSHSLFLQQYRKILTKKGQLKFKTDNRELFLWSLEQFVAMGWQFNELTFDLHESELSEDYKIMTHYETKFTAEGIPTNYCAVLPARTSEPVI